MAVILTSEQAAPDQLRHLSPAQRYWLYNGLDCCVTFAVHQELAKALPREPAAQVSYQFVRAMQGPALEMMRRGIAIQQEVRQNAIEEWTAKRAKAQATLDRLADAVWGPALVVVVDRAETWVTPIGKRGQPLKPRKQITRTERVEQRPLGLNANSDKQLLAFFNTALQYPVQYAIRKRPGGIKERTPSADDKALRKWAERRTRGPGISPRDYDYELVHYAQPFVSLIQTIRECDKALEVYTFKLSPDGRARWSYNPAGTENGRWSSSGSAFGVGRNMQNIDPLHRRQFCADDNHWFVNTDYEQAESRLVAALVWQCTGDDTYWRACESGDLHTLVCQMTWPELEWTDDPKANRAIADRDYPGVPGFSYRDTAKRLGHGTNYWGTAFGIAQAVGVPVELVQDFQRRYFKAFPAISRWHKWVADFIRTHHYLETPLGRRRYFFGRVWDDSTIREAIAFVPQSTIGELLNLALYRVWIRSLPAVSNNMGPEGTRSLSPLNLQILLQNHDAFSFQVPYTADLPATLAAVRTELEIPLPITSYLNPSETRHLIIPGEFATGFNWGYADKGDDPSEWKYKDGNPDGLRKWKGAETRKRQQSATTSASDWANRKMA